MTTDPYQPRAIAATWCLWGMLLASACGSSGPIAGPQLPERPGTEAPAPVVLDSDLTSSPRIDSAEMWAALAARPDNAVFARTEVVKFMIDLQDDRALYFANSRRWPIHYDFAEEFLDSPERRVVDHETFNVREYRHADRRFVLGSVVHYLDPDVWTFEMIAGDTLPGPRVLRAFTQVRDAVYFGEQLRYRALSDVHRTMLTNAGGAIPTISTEQAMGGVRYQPLTNGTAFGYVRMIQGELQRANARPNDILVTATVPNDLPLCSALITSALQAPLAHVAVLSQNRGTPNMALRDALTDARITRFADQLVKITVGPQDFTIATATQSQADAHWAALRPAQGFTPSADFSRTGLVDMCTMRVADARTVGAKAAQLGEVCALRPAIQTPGGFVIPFHYYNGHLEQNSLRGGVEQMLSDGDFVANRAQREQRLSELRSIIERVTIDPRLVRDVRRRLGGSATQRFIFRSSTNAEDLPGFNGAGLYRSVVVGPRPTQEQVADTIRQVWASVWTLRGYEERDWYRIDHRTVAMGVLVQPFVDNIVANGVAITRNPFNDDRPAVFINVQTRAGSVTDAGNDVPEQHLVYTYTEAPEPEVLSRSSLTGGAPILAMADVQRLTDVLTRIHSRLAQPDDRRADAIDVEFLVRQNRDIVVVQARPYPR